MAVVHPRDLSRVAGRDTRIVSISGHDFLGINPPTSTFTDFVRSGPPYNRMKFLELMHHPVMSRVTTVAGGKSAWQLASPYLMDRLGLDHVHLGEGERTVPRTFAASLPVRRSPRSSPGKKSRSGRSRRSSTRRSTGWWNAPAGADAAVHSAPPRSSPSGTRRPTRSSMT